MANITLNSSMRSNLLSLQQTASLQSLTQNRLSTGLKVNSAIDNAGSFYTASSLNNRAKDLSTLLDSMAMGISTLKATSEALSSSANFLEQASAVAGQSFELFSSIVATVSTEAELLDAINSGQKGAIVIDGKITLSENQNLILNDGQSLIGTEYFNPNTAIKSELIFDTKGGNVAGFDNSCIKLGNSSSVSNLLIHATSDSNGTNVIIADNVKNTHIKDVNITYNNTGTKGIANSLIKAQNDAQLAISGEYKSQGSGGYVRTILSNNKSHITIEENAKINSRLNGYILRFMEITNATIDIMPNAELNFKGLSTNTSDGVTAINVSQGSTLNVYDAKINFLIDVNPNGESVGLNCNPLGANKINLLGKTKVNIHALGAKTKAIRVASGAINIGKDVELNLGLQQSNLKFMVLDTSPQSASLNIAKGAKIYFNDSSSVANSGTWIANNDYNLLREIGNAAIHIPTFNGNPFFQNLGIAIPPPAFADLIIDFNNNNWNSDTQIKNSITQYNNILSQFDSLISDANYKGLNLLQGQNLTINFNATRTSNIKINGVDASSNGLGIKKADWENQDDITKSISEIASAVKSIRSFQEEFGNQYSVVQNREEFTKNLINVLTEGADKLTLADMNQESANSLALDTRQQLATNALSLASQAAQSVLKLF